MTIREQRGVRLSVKSRFDDIEISSKPFPSREDAEAHLAENPPDEGFEADIYVAGSGHIEGEFS